LRGPAASCIVTGARSAAGEFNKYHKRGASAMILNVEYFRRRICRVFLRGMLFAGIFALVLCKAHGQAEAEQAEERVRARLSGFWQAMQDADYEKAITFIQSDSRRTFNKLPKSRVNQFKISSLKFNDDYTECDTTTMVSKPTPQGVFEWPLQNHWLLQDGEWYLKIPWGENENPMLQAFKERRAVTEMTKPSESTAPAPRPAKTGNIVAMMEAMNRLRPDPSNPPIVHFGEKARFLFSFSNEGKTPVRILSAHSDCHCTGVQSEYPEVPPGQSGTLEVMLDTLGLPMGMIEKHVTVQFSDLSFPVDLPILVRNAPNYKIVPSSVDFGDVKMGKPVEKSVRVLNESGRAVKILSRLKSDPRLEFFLDKSSLAPGAEMTVVVRYDPASPGEFLDALMLYTDLSAEPILSIPVRGTAKP